MYETDWSLDSIRLDLVEAKLRLYNATGEDPHVITSLNE